jgi:hypothetical protein
LLGSNLPSTRLTITSIPVAPDCHTTCRRHAVCSPQRTNIYWDDSVWQGAPASGNVAVHRGGTLSIEALVPELLRSPTKKSGVVPNTTHGRV